ncbi:hypothetical protein AXG93_4332s1090 [Marchantia polymorpha subsp. ruderalis]|uniref:7,8-dihydroneopterin aldolase n=1 Tax=Marchantia polymorpha subsp. ruderalis TaxID=1480154 RepID=A0A176W3K1_MARPO|nr:hypothetical protein AXG93_4332s1090 [Marchantia polymorpha subsp. ruderalis]
MARRYSAALLGAVRNCGESQIGRCCAAQNGGVLQNRGDLQGHPKLIDQAVAAFRRSVSSYEGNGGSKIPERVGGKDRLILRGGKFHGYHGVLEEEKRLGQKFLVDVDAWLELRKSGSSDDLNDSVSYADLFSIVQKILEGPSFDLVEKVATEIAREKLVEFTVMSSAINSGAIINPGTHKDKLEEDKPGMPYSGFELPR